MHPPATIERAFALHARGLNVTSIARSLSVSRASVTGWLAVGSPELIETARQRRRSTVSCPSRCPLVARSIAQCPRAYAYLFGQYPGDGSIARVGRVWRLAITCCDAYPQIMDECERVVHEVSDGRKVRRASLIGCTNVESYSAHWTCLFPQHGPGPKHMRSIQLEPWQRELAIDLYPRDLLRGLIHSDGCRITNWTEKLVGGRRKRYEYPRYFFSNRSTDMLGIFEDACCRIGVDTRRNNPYAVSVATRGSVAELDRFIGPKQ